MFNFHDRKKKSSRIIVGIIVLFLVLCMILPLLSGILGYY